MNPTIVMKEVTDEKELAEARARREKFDRNAAWLHNHAAEVYPKYRGKFICIAGEQLFVGESPQEAIKKAKKSHPEDDGWFVHYIPKQKLARIYANERRMVFV